MTGTIDITKAKFLDGPKFVAWLETQVDHQDIGEVRALGPTLGKRIREWRNGMYDANVYVADLVLIKLGLALGMVPDDIYVDHAMRKQHQVRLGPVERDQVRQMAKNGEPYWKIAAKFHVHVSTVARIVTGKRRR